MSDIDFEELDKAVNTLMAGVDTTKRNPALDDPEDRIVALEAKDAEENGSPVPDAANGDSAPATPAAPASDDQPQASLAVKRRGQFMDMIHPSSNMKTTPRAPKREGIAIAPASAAPTPAPEVVATPPVDIPALIEEPALQVADDIAAPAPLVSPFLPDAKPEKRPLGSPLVSQPIDQPPEAVADTDDTDIDKQIPLEGGQQILPEELQTDILAVESNDLTAASVVSSEQSAPETPAPAEELPAPEVPTDTPTAEVAVEVAPEPVVEASEPTPEPASEPVEAQPEVVADTPPVSTTSGSIPQQYAESPSTGDQTMGSIYDTANYHQPIEATAPTKKGSVLKWALAVLGLLLVGAAAGVGYFFLLH